MVSTKLQKFEVGIKESHQDLAESVNREIVDPYKFKRKGNEQQFLFNQKISLETASAVNSLKQTKSSKPGKNYKKVCILLPNVRSL